MKLILKPLILFFLMIPGFLSCKQDTLKADVAPLATAMCQFIEIQNQLRSATIAGDSLAIAQYSADQQKMKIELTILNQEFQEKYGDLIKDTEFGKKFRLEMNKAMIDCPHLSVEDRARMEAATQE